MSLAVIVCGVFCDGDDGAVVFSFYGASGCTQLLGTYTVSGCLARQNCTFSSNCALFQSCISRNLGYLEFAQCMGSACQSVGGFISMHVDGAVVEEDVFSDVTCSSTVSHGTESTLGQCAALTNSCNATNSVVALRSSASDLTSLFAGLL